MKRWNRWLSLSLMLILLATAAPSAVWAEEASVQPVDPEAVEQTVELAGDETGDAPVDGDTAAEAPEEAFELSGEEAEVDLMEALGVVTLEGVVYVRDPELGDLTVALPAEALPATAEGLDADQAAVEDGVLVLRAAWLYGLAAGEYDVTLLGGDGARYLVPLTVLDNPSLTAAGDVSVDGVSFSGTENRSGSGWRWNAADRTLTVTGELESVDCPGGALTLSCEGEHELGSLSADSVTLVGGDDGRLIVGEVHATQVTLRSGDFSFCPRADEDYIYTNLDCDRLTVSGGSLYVGTGFVSEKVSVSRGALYVGRELRGDVVRSVGALSVTGGELDTSRDAEIDFLSLSFTGGYSHFGVGGYLATSNLTMTGGVVEISADNFYVRGTFSATGGDLSVYMAQDYGAALRANTLVLGGTLNAYVYSGASLVNASSVNIGGLKKIADGMRRLVMENGKVVVLDEGGKLQLKLGHAILTDEDLDAEDLGDSQEGWFWDMSAQTLYLYNFDGDVWIGRPMTVRLVGGTTMLGDITAEAGLTLVGDGALFGNVTNKTGDLVFNNHGVMSGSLKNECGNIAMNGARMASGVVYAERGSVSIKDCNLTASYVDAEGDLTIANSVVYTTDRDAYYKEWNDIYALKKLKVTSSVLICHYYAGDAGTSVDGASAVFQWNYWDRNGYYSNCFSLRKKATLKQDFVLPNVSYYVPRAASLSVAKGKTVICLGNLSRAGKVSGNFRTPNALYRVEVVGDARMAAGTSQRLGLKVYPADAYPNVRWISNDPMLAEVDSDGTVHLTEEAYDAIGETVIIRAESEDNDDCWSEFAIAIVPGAKSAAIQRNGAKLNALELWLDPANKTAQLSAAVVPAEASQGLEWHTSNAKIASVDASGLVTALKAGKAEIWGTTKDGTDLNTQRVLVTVLKAPGSVKVATKKLNLSYDEDAAEALTFQLTATLPAGSGSTLTYSGYDEKVLTVSDTGLITVRGSGTTKITVATYNKKKAVVTVKVTSPYDPTGVQILNADGAAVKGTLRLKVGETLKLNSALLPLGVARGSVAWMSSSAKVATVSADGLVEAVKAGSAKITVTAPNGKKATVSVKVVK